jgi:hypothetical protein
MQLYVVNYKGHQVHSTAPFVKATGPFVVFEGGGVADVESGESYGASLLVSPDSSAWLPPGSSVGTAITVIDVTDDGTVYTRTAAGSSAVSPDGTYSVSLGDPHGANRGVQLGNGNIQVNRF